METHNSQRDKQEISSKAEDPVQNYIAININWGDKLVFPYDEGMKFITAMKYAEEVSEDEDGFVKIIPSTMNVRTRIISRQEYIKLKSRTLLNLSAPPGGDNVKFKF